MTQTPVGRRERKKAATRQSIADAALRLFLDRGYDAVSTRDVADAADVSTTTLFKHFPSKEALVFDQEGDQDERLVAAVRRRADRSVPEALRQHVLDTFIPFTEHPQHAQFNRLVDTTPALRAYSERMWTRHTETLAAAIAGEFGAPPDDVACLALARFVLDIPSLARAQVDPRAAVETVFDVLTHGWQPPTPQERAE